jgi:cytochrome P450 family 4
LSSEISFEQLENTQEEENFLKLVMNEKLRMEPSVPLSTSFCMTEDVEIVGIPVKKGQMMMINI